MRSALNRLSHTILFYSPVLLAFLLPLFFLPITADIFAFNKFYLISALGSLSLIAWSLFLLTKNKLNLTISPSLLPLFLLVLTYLVSTIWFSSIQHLSLFGSTSTVIALFIIFLTSTSTQKTNSLSQAITLSVIASLALLNLFSLLHYFGVIGSIFENDLLTNKYFNPAGGVLPALSLTLPILVGTIAYAIKTEKTLNRFVLLLSSAIMISGSVVNISLLLPQGDKAVIAFLPYRAGWSIAVDIFKRWGTALFGTGPDTYLATFTKLRPAYLNLNSNLWSLRFTESSSYLLTVVTTTGVLGLIFFSLAFLKPIFISLKASGNISDSNFYFYKSSLLALFLSFVFLPTGINSLGIGIALLIGFTLFLEHEKHHAVKDFSLSLAASSEESILNTSFLPWLTTITSITLLSLYWYFAVPTYKASVLIKQASQILSSDVTGSFLKQNNASRTDPYNPNYQIILSQTYQNVAKYYLNKETLSDDDKKNAIETMQRAIDAGKQAARLDPLNVNVWENLANVYSSFIGVADGASNLALSHLAQAISTDPTNPRLRLQMGILYFNLGDSDQATKLVSQALDLKQNWDLPYFNMAMIYKSKKDYPRALQYMRLGLAQTTLKDAELEKIQEEVKSLEKLSSNASPSAATR